MAFIRKTVFMRNTSDVQSGIKVALTNFESYFQDLEKQTEIAAQASAEVIINEALPLTPMDTGALRESARPRPGQKDIAVGRGKGGNITSVAGFGGPDTGVGYAVIIHENLNAGPGGQKSYKTPGTGPKFLEKGASLAIRRLKSLFEGQLKKARPK